MIFNALRRLAAIAGGVAFAVLPSAGAADTGSPTFTEAEIKIILSLGPWGKFVPPDPSNRVSGNPDAIDFGTHLFLDQRLSGGGTVSCSSCHVPERNWTDNMHRGIGNAVARKRLRQDRNDGRTSARQRERAAEDFGGRRAAAGEAGGGLPCPAPRG